jgi:predicted GNAT superfamily acetyltransferase
MTSISTGVDAPITIRRAETLADYRACQAAQRRAWGITDDGYLIPIATMVGANLHGGLVLGAFLPDGESVAISFAFLGRIGGRLCQYSQLTGVVPEYQSRGLGYQIKILQRDLALRDGLDRIAWAFDPLQAGNAHFNLTRLGATAGHFVPNMYGERTDALNASVPTDRLIVEWNLTVERSRDPASTSDFTATPKLIDVQVSTDTARVPIGLRDPIGDEPAWLLEIPGDIASLRRNDPHLAEQWRRLVSQAFQAAFANGFRAMAFLRDDSGGRRRGFYLLGRI